MTSGTVRGLALSRSFSEDALAYFNERLDPRVTRDALVATARLARQQRLAGGSRIGLAVDGTSAGHTGSSTSVAISSPATRRQGRGDRAPP
ncbi:MAG: hypothetical protein IPK26_29125 [Planctomycetes bacterium]|nr:hypothetical protein [Planctomycetota bacterium]